MTEAQQEQRARRKPAAKGSRRKTEAPRAAETARAGADGANLKDHVDQLGTILTKAIDFVEAGIGLGVTVVNRVSSVAQRQVVDQVIASATQMTGQPRATAGGAPGPVPAAVEPVPLASAESAATASESGLYFITNRLPLTPGAAAEVSFSINNDSMAAPKRVELTLEGFIGESTHATIDGTAFAIKPARKTIKPMDFDKFVLAGPVAADTPPDVFYGRIVVRSDTELTIPIRLVVAPL